MTPYFEMSPKTQIIMNFSYLGRSLPCCVREELGMFLRSHDQSGLLTGVAKSSPIKCKDPGGSAGMLLPWNGPQLGCYFCSH